ncbi:MAG: Type IV pilus assembly protein PilM [Candidatus Magasanikbacteria bacterium GW2011_GWC2_37_14]|uniref:Type IV pilus assembly protein PilM n=1 Tax=Candidatus Magasanikbacteria bacterium GW2011_GWC2_37_14 TaxID=1619046 RepID=A0A0G0JIE7_9BACT|nr:MAG: Type IV pilus assembly protein PilM [Candidatus Magasanikbacteria bacterium GW2011_GWC2_37_14]
MFNNPFPGAFGLDIGDLSIKLIQIENQSFFNSKPTYNLKNYRSIELPPGLIVNGELEKPEEVRRRIMRLLKGRGDEKPITSPWVVVALPETQSFIKLIKTNTPAKELFEDDIKNLAKKHIPYDDDGSYYIQWQIMPDQENSEEKTRILIGAVPKRIADNYTYLLESLGLGVVALEVEALSIARSMITANKEYEQEARGLLDLGATRSSFIVYDHDIIQFSTSLPFSGEIITTAIAQQLHITQEEAEKIKIEKGLSFQNHTGKAWNIMLEMTDKLIDYLEDSFQFYYSHFPEANKITRITMCGGGSNMAMLDKTISKRLKVIASPGHPWKNLFSKKEPKINYQESLGCATAIGLALRAADNPFYTKDVL